IVSAIAVTATPPTVTVQLSGDTTDIPGLRYLDSYSPVVGNTVAILKQGTDLLVIGRVAEEDAAGVSGWQTASLGSGFSHNANGGGNFEYRRVWDNGAWKVQFKGMVGRSSGTTI